MKQTLESMKKKYECSTCNQELAYNLTNELNGLYEDGRKYYHTEFIGVPGQKYVYRLICNSSEVVKTGKRKDICKMLIKLINEYHTHRNLKEEQRKQSLKERLQEEEDELYPTQKKGTGNKTLDSHIYSEQVTTFCDNLKKSLMLNDNDFLDYMENSIFNILKVPLRVVTEDVRNEHHQEYYILNLTNDSILFRSRYTDGSLTQSKLFLCWYYLLETGRYEFPTQTDEIEDLLVSEDEDDFDDIAEEMIETEYKDEAVCLMQEVRFHLNRIDSKMKELENIIYG